jgi:hypothetical protein
MVIVLSFPIERSFVAAFGIEAMGRCRLVSVPGKSSYSRNSKTAALPQMERSFGASLLRRYGFRRVLLVNGTLTVLIIVGCPALTPSTPTR